MAFSEEEIAALWERAEKALPPRVTFSGSASAKADRIRAMELCTLQRGTPEQILAFINGESTTTLQTPLTRLLQACYNTFLAQDMKDHVAVFDRVTDMRDAYGGVLQAMDELRIERPKVEGAVPEPAEFEDDEDYEG